MPQYLVNKLKIDGLVYSHTMLMKYTLEKLNIKKRKQHFLTYWHKKYKYYQKYCACPIKDFRQFGVTARDKVTLKTGLI